MRLGSACKRSEAAISFNTQGPPGIPGPKGDTGPQGPKGDSGTANVTSLQTAVNQMQGQINTLQSKITDGSSYQAAIEQLQADVRTLQGLPKVDPIGVFENDYLYAQVVGLTRVFSSTDGSAYVTATFQLKNKSTETIYLAYDESKRFTVADDHGISVQQTAFYGDLKGIRGVDIQGNGTEARQDFSVLAPGSVISVGLVSPNISKDFAAKLGNRFNLTFSLVRYLEPNLAQSNKLGLTTVGFANITATQ